MVDDPYGPYRDSMRASPSALGPGTMAATIQASFNAGEWSPALYARVDLQKYRSGAALLQNWYVDYRGGASTRPGSKYVIQAFKSSKPVRLIPFQASFLVGYVLEFGDFYMRPLFNGAPILLPSTSITAITQANPCVVTAPAHGLNPGDWLFISGVGGMTFLNGRYFIASATTTNTITLSDLNGNPIDSTWYAAYTTGGSVAKIYIISSPFAAADLELVKYAQNVGELILCHPNYQAQVLNLLGPTNWTITPISVGATIAPPTSVAVSTTMTGSGTYYAYVVTSIDANGQESNASAIATLSNVNNIRNQPAGATNTVSWVAAPGAVAYNVYEAELTIMAPVPAGAIFGFIGTTKGTSFSDSNIAQDFSQTPPISQNPFLGGAIATATVTAGGAYTAVPTVTLTGGSPVVNAALNAVLQIASQSVASSTYPASVGDSIVFPNGVILVVATTSGGRIATFQPLTYPGTNPGNLTGAGASAPSTLTAVKGGLGGSVTINVTWTVGAIDIVQPGLGYSSVPTIGFSTGAAAATATLTTPNNPGAVSFFQQRLVLAASITNPQTFWMSKAGEPFNFDTSIPSAPDDAITGTIVSSYLNNIKSMVPVATGLLVLTDKGPWLVNGGGPGAAVSPSAIVANANSYVGASDVPPIVANYDILHVQSKGSAVRDLSFNIYWSVFTGSDISITASHLFYGFTLNEWAWAEQPFYIAWAVRNDGTMLTLTYMKEQDFVGWSHQVTQGSYLSVATVVEPTSDAGNVDAVYTVVQRTVNSNVVKYIERIADRAFPNGVADAWCVDAAIQYVGPPASVFSGAEHLAGLTVTGLADGVVIPPFIMPTTGVFTTVQSHSKLTIGLAFTCDLQTLALDVGEPTVQGRVKKINAVVARVKDTLGLSIGPDFDHLTPMKDLILGNVSSMLTGQESQVITGLTTGDARTLLGAGYTVPGQYCIRQSLPLPATVLGLIPNFTLGDTK